MPSPARNAKKAEKERLWAIESERLANTRREKEDYFSELTAKLNALGIDPQLLKEYLDQL